MNASESGTVISFYSYKGGTGRSMAVANIACLLAKHVDLSANRVLVTDWDLESPGLHNYFSSSEQAEFKNQKGIIDYFVDLHRLLRKKRNLYEQISGENGVEILDKSLAISDYIIPDVIPKLDFIKAGRFDADYANRVNSFGWMKFFNKYREVISVFRELLTSKYSYVLVDSRTGVTDISGICTMLLPEKLVWVFTPNKQSLHGVTKLIRQAIEYRRASDDFRPLAVFPLPSRIDDAEHKLRANWLDRYKSEFESAFKKAYNIEQSDLSEYFREVKIPYKSYYAYGEKIAVLEEPDESLSLHRAYRYFFDKLINLDFAWQKDSIKKNIKVFISYAKEDFKVARKIYTDLKGAGITPWLDRENLLVGQKWRETISRAISESSYFLLIISNNSVSKKGYIQKEQKIALELLEELPENDIFIIPVIIDSTELADEKLRYLHWADLSDYERGLTQILKTLKSANFEG